jgi:hypothetical protein
VIVANCRLAIVALNDIERTTALAAIFSPRSESRSPREKNLRSISPAIERRLFSGPDSIPRAYPFALHFPHHRIPNGKSFLPSDQQTIPLTACIRLAYLGFDSRYLYKYSFVVFGGATRQHRCGRLQPLAVSGA